MYFKLHSFEFSQHVSHVTFLLSCIGYVYFCLIQLHIQLCRNFTFFHFMVAFDYYQMESEFKYSVRNSKDREN